MSWGELLDGVPVSLELSRPDWESVLLSPSLLPPVPGPRREEKIK